MSFKSGFAACLMISAAAAIGAPAVANAQATSKENNATSGSMHSKHKMKKHSKSSSMKHRPATDAAKRAPG